MVIWLALGSAITFGAADFWGGLASRRAPSAGVVAVAQVISLPVVLLWCLLSTRSAAGSDLAWGAASGAAGAGGVLLLYKGLADGRMSVVAPLTGLVAAGLPVVVSPLLGELPSALALVGIAIAMAAIALVSRDGEAHADDQTVATMSRGAMVAVAVASGVCFGALFLLLDQAREDASMWPLVANKFTGLLVVGAYGLFVARTGLRVGRSALPLVFGCAVGGAAAEVLLLLAMQNGLVAIAAVITSLYPGSTVLLARFVLHERLRKDQLAGFALAALAVGLIAAG
ncbi:MAG TPA: EamA family transporter [Acidimicrobiales bacterium]|nr:EamA family transporter [Acidimicrobiales bacterium]